MDAYKARKGKAAAREEVKGVIMEVAARMARARSRERIATVRRKITR